MWKNLVSETDSSRRLFWRDIFPVSLIQNINGQHISSFYRGESSLDSLERKTAKDCMMTTVIFQEEIREGIREIIGNCSRCFK